MTAQDLLERLREFDLLLDTDPKFPSVTGSVAGPDVRGSWWAHPQSHEMFRLGCALRNHPDVLVVKLISGKVTLVHRPLWPAIVAIGSAREPWQMRGLSRDALVLLGKLGRAGKMSSSGDAVRELEKRLLIRSESVHTERGYHEKQIESWQSWAKPAKLGKIALTAAEAKAQLEAVVARINQQFGANGTLPWQSKPRTSRRAHNVP
jgi:hypothetical protein